MITENAIVTSIENNQTWIETQRKSACGQCAANKGCGTSVLSKVMGNKRSKMKAINKIDAQPGDKVIVGLQEKSLLKGAFIVYMLPLLLLFLFSLLGQIISHNFLLFDNEMFVVIFAALGFYIGMRKVKSFSESIAENENYQPVILKKSDSSSLFFNP